MLVIRLNLTFQYSLKTHLNHPGKCWVTQGENLNKIGPNKFMGGGEVLGGVHFVWYAFFTIYLILVICMAALLRLNYTWLVKSKPVKQ